MGAIEGYDIPPRGPEPRKCPRCKGTGHEGYRAFNIRTRREVDVTEHTWLCLPPGEDEAYDAGKNYCRMDLETCRECNGEGVIYDIYRSDA